MKIAKSSVNIKNLFSLTLITAFFLVSVISIIAQPQPNNPDRGSKVGSAYAVSDFETINTNNGNLMFNFSLGSLPKGRGEVGGGISLMYSSKLYDTHTERIQDMTVPCGGGPCTYFQKIIIDESDKGGWKYVLGSYELKVEDRRERYRNTTLPVCWLDGQGTTAAWEEMTYVYKVNMVFPDGSSHEMIPKGQTPSADGQRFYRINPDGEFESCGSPVTQNDRPTYYSIDGSYLRLVKTSSNGWILYFPDGKKIVTTSSSQRTYDRNGNYVDGPNDEWGRTVSIIPGSNDDEHVIRSMGANGEKLEWKVLWKNIFVKKTYQACTPIPGNNCPQEHQRKDLTVSLRVVDQIIQPQQLGGQAYTFTYKAPDDAFPSHTSEGWGEVSGVTLPGGAHIDYEYAMDGEDGPDDDWNIDEILKNYPTAKTLTYDLLYDGSTTSTSETWTYSTNASQGTVVSPDGSSVTNYFGSSPNGWDSGLTYKTVSSTGTMTEKLWERNFPEVCSPSTACNPLAPANTYVKTEFNSIKDSSGNYSLTAIKDYTYDKNGNATLVKEYDWVAYSTVPRDQYGNVTGIPSGITPKRISATGYYGQTPNAATLSADTNIYISPASPALKGTVEWSEIRNGSNQAVSRTEITYDNAATTGNPIEAKAWDNTKGIYSTSLDSSPSGNAISTKAQYNSYGMPTVTTDANGVQTTITYANIDTPTGPVSDLYPTKIETASNYSALKRTSTFTYDFLTGLTLTSTDLDNGITNSVQYDDAGRPKKSISAEGTALESWTVTEYDDALRRIIVRSDLEALGDGKKVAIQHFDPLGRVRLSRTLENAATEDATDEHDGIKVQTRYSASGTCSFDSGQVCSFQLTSNPYRAATSSAASSEPTMGWTRSQGAALGKHSEVETFSGGSLPAPWGSNSNSTGVSSKQIEANVLTFSDQSGKKHKNVSDSLGRLKAVIEDPDGQNLSTEYLFDERNNLRKITQGGQIRYFMFSSLSRVLYAKQTEQEANTNFSGSGHTDGITGNNQWSVKYGYDNNGNIISTTDARNNTTNAHYDAHNRLTLRDYSDPNTSDVTVSYDDPTVSFSKGVMTKVENGVSERRFTSLDIFGRILQSQQIVDGQTYTINYKYDLSGKLVEEIYPSGRAVKNTFDEDGDIAQVQSRRAGAGYWTYGSGFGYTANKEIQKFQLGNGHWENTAYNPRLQITQIKLGAVDNGEDILKLAFDYGTSDNNDSLKSQTITISNNVTTFTADQIYTYDNLNRIKSSTETISGAQAWKQTFLYDRFGNRRFETTGNQTTTLDPNLPAKVTNPIINASDNRFQGDQDLDSVSEYFYDKEGNLIKDAQNRQIFYNSENQQKEVKNANGTTLGLYYYDANGKRVKKVTSTEMVIFIYDESNKLVEEYSTQLADTPQVSYLTLDGIDSPRVITNASGAVINRTDYTAFGEKISTLQRKDISGYENINTTKQDFTGYFEESENDSSFAQARYYDKFYGRFSSVDPLPSSAVIENPQSLNRYSYSYNSPYRFKDPLGLSPSWKTNGLDDNFPIFDGGSCATRAGKCIPGGLTPVKSGMSGGKGDEDDATILLPNSLLAHLAADAAYFRGKAQQLGFEKGKALSAVNAQRSIVTSRSATIFPDYGEGLVPVEETIEGLLIVPDEVEIESSASLQGFVGGRASSKLYPGKQVEAYNTARSKLNAEYDQRREIFIKAWLGVVVPVSESRRGYKTANLTEKYLSGLYRETVGVAFLGGITTGFQMRGGPSGF